MSTPLAVADDVDTALVLWAEKIPTPVSPLSFSLLFVFASSSCQVLCGQISWSSGHLGTVAETLGFLARSV